MDAKDYELIRKFGEEIHQLMVAYKMAYESPIKMPGIRKLTPIENELLSLLEWDDEISMKTISKILGVANSTITSAVNRLENKGLITRIVTDGDKRAFNLKLTNDGRDVTNFRKFKKTQFFTEILQSLNTVEERVALVELVGKVSDAMMTLTDDQKRRSHMNALEKEYYDFGPWLIEVKEYDDIPSQYHSKRDVILSASYCFKVPIKKEWRNTHPGMLLYHTVIAVHPEKVVILKAKDGDVEQTEIPVEDIRYIVHSTDLLDSHIIISTDVDLFDIDYNSVSQEISNQVINMMREYVFKVSDKVHLEEIHEVKHIESSIYRELMNKGKVGDSMKVIAFQPFMKLERHNPSTLEVILQTHKKYELQDMAILTNGKELIVVNRNKEVKRTKDVDYSFRHTFIQFDDISKITLVDEPDMEHLRSLVIHVGDTKLSFKVSDAFDANALIDLIS